jgi:hypothetical protein
MNHLKLTIGRLQRDILVAAPGLVTGHIKLRVPEFYAKTQARNFAIDQVLCWRTVDGNGTIHFSLDVPPEEVGIDYHGSAALQEGDQLEFLATIANFQGEDILAAHHTIHLDLSTLEGFDDPRNERTFVFTDTGWKNLAALLPPAGPRTASARVGASYQHTTIIWKVVALMSESRDRVIAFALDRAYAFANNHPEWPKGLLIGCRWGTLYKDEELTARGKLYLCRGGLEELQALYVKDFK